MLVTLLVAVLLGGVLVMGLEAVFHPWAYYLGGHFHWLPGWAGLARVQTPAGEYVIYVWVQPSQGGSRVYNLPYFRGTGALCTPHGERFRLQARGGLSEKVGTDTIGKTMSLRLFNRPWFWSFAGTWDHRPELQFRGTWQDRSLVTDDGGSFTSTFLPDGTLSKNRPLGYYHSDATDKIPIVFHELSGVNAWFKDCRQ
jgi:hypothetical protein